jgi:hypothetical protein
MGMVGVVATIFAGTSFVFILSIIPSMVGILLILSAYSFQTSLLKFSFISREQQELFVDSMVVLTTRQPLALIRALKKVTHSILPESPFNLSEYRGLLRPRLLKDRPGLLENRARQVLLINLLLKDHVSLSIKREVKDFSSCGFFGRNVRLYFSPFSRALDKIDKRTVKEVYEYLRLNAQKFNLVKCAGSTGISLHETFIVFACLLMADIVGQHSELTLA